MNEKKIDYKYDKPNGSCSHCGAPLNEYLIGGYRLHNGEYSVGIKHYKQYHKEALEALEIENERKSNVFSTK